MTFQFIIKMGELFKNKYRIASTRLPYWDYSKSGKYYVTICTKDRKCCFGEIKNNYVYLSEIGKIVFAEWLKTPQIRSYVLLDDFIIMPNHLHGIIEIKNDKDFDGENCRDAPRRVSTGNNFAPLPSKSLSSIINHFKGSVKRQCDKNDLAFAWQERYYDHIVRDEDDYGRIKEYIALNPINWSKDRNNPIKQKMNI